MKKLIPNLITLCNLLCGILASMMALHGSLSWAALFIVLGILFDFFDGMVARLLHVASPLGKELDSLADLVTSGVAPGFILFSIFQNYHLEYISFLALLIPLFAAYRLAKFNIDSRQTHSFIGLPAPANALFWAVLGFCYRHPYDSFCSSPFCSLSGVYTWLFSSIAGSVFISIALLLLCFLMVSEIPMFSLKLSNLSWSDNKLQYIFLIGCVVLVATFYLPGIALCILWYILLSVVNNILHA